MRKKIYLLDVSGYLFRSYYALPRMTNIRGESTHALYGFVRSLQKIMKDFNPDYIAAVFDGPENKRSRTEIYSDYKVQRAKAPEDLPHQIGWAQEFCSIYGIPQLSVEGVEADDTIGSVVQWALKHDFEVFICTGDKDLCQLVSPHVFVLQTHKENLLLDAAKVEEVYGVAPNQIVDYLALIGDASDNIPGIPGIGPKTASAMLQEYKTLENLLANAAHVSGKKKQELLMQNEEAALLSKRLAVIDTSVEVPQEDAFYKRTSPNQEALHEMYKQMNYNTLLKELNHQAPVEAAESIQPAREVNYELVDDEQGLVALQKELEAAGEASFDTETTALDPIRAELVGVGFATAPGRAWYLPARGKLGLDRVIQFLKPLFANGRIGFYGHHVKYDLHVLKNYGIDVKNVCFDTMLASYLLNSHSHRHSLEHVALLYLGYTKNSIKELIGKEGKAISMADVPIEEVKDYCCLDVDLTCQLKEKTEAELKHRGLLKLLLKLELPLVKVLFQMERHGIFVDKEYLNGMSKEMAELITGVEEQVYEMASERFNLNSPKQLGQILYEKLGINPGKKTSTGQFSTNVDVLESLVDQYPIAAKILEYRTLEKLRSTYVDKLPEEINPSTGRIHCSFNQTVAATGRLSCQDPNLQNIPVRTEVGSRIRQAFKPEKKGWSYLSADYSQIELRILAHLSADPQLILAFSNDEDIHAYTASLIFNVPLKEVTKEQRHHAKAVNFGIVYGQQAFGLSQELGISTKEAALFIDTYFSRYKRVREFMEENKETARRTGKAVTMTGRERIIPDMNSKNPVLRNAAERLAINTPLQGSAADLIKQAMLNADARLHKEQMLSFMVLQIHDELLFETPDFELIHLQSLAKEVMESVFTLKVPLKVDIAVGKNWKEC